MIALLLLSVYVDAAADESLLDALERGDALIPPVPTSTSGAIRRVPAALIDGSTEDMYLAGPFGSTFDQTIVRAMGWPEQPRVKNSFAVLGVGWTNNRGRFTNCPAPGLLIRMPESERRIVKWVWSSPPSIRPPSVGAGRFVALEERRLDFFSEKLSTLYPAKDVKGSSKEMIRGAEDVDYFTLYSPAMLYALGLGVLSKLSGDLGAPALALTGTALHYPHATRRDDVLALFERTDAAGQSVCGAVCTRAQAVYTTFYSFYST